MIGDSDSIWMISRPLAQCFWISSLAMVMAGKFVGILQSLTPLISDTLFNYPADIRKAIYTTNAIESLNSVIRKAIKKRKFFPTGDAAKKSGISCDTASLKEMDDADPELENRPQSLYD